jgi:prevent-host-death family protein
MASLPKSLLTEASGKTTRPAAKSATGLGKAIWLRRVHGQPIAASKAKTHLLQLLDQVERDRTPVPITKRGRVVAQLVPVAPQSDVSAFDRMFGRTRGWMKISGDIVSPDHESWGPDWR